jgi:hypothetical protein
LAGDCIGSKVLLNGHADKWSQLQKPPL